MDDDMPEISCPECGAVFSVVWHRSPLIENVEFCPFCGFENSEWTCIGEERD